MMKMMIFAIASIFAGAFFIFIGAGIIFYLIDHFYRYNLLLIWPIVAGPSSILLGLASIAIGIVFLVFSLKKRKRTLIDPIR